jgi:activator of 2-hydroxyglutaryl-CoA dehydratase/predicted nucleotide-binding protein (sugar kinase/HSP70/actin superfamily)
MSTAVPRQPPENVVIGIDVGSTTAKCVVLDPSTREILWKRYERHETRQAEKVAEMLAEIEREFSHIDRGRVRAFITGSGAGPLARPIGARFVQEVNAVTIAVDRLCPEFNSVIELGGQDAKVILFQQNPETGERRVFTSMNDKCASGTGATIDKCLLKVGMERSALATLAFDKEKLHRVAARCGVFAETDVVNLMKAAVPASEVMNSLGNAVVMQNLTVLPRGNTLYPKVLLLGGPNTFLPFLRDCWRLRIAEIWKERGVVVPDRPLSELIVVPENAQYFAAVGAALFGIAEPAEIGAYRGLDELQAFIAHGRKAQLGESAGPPLISSDEDLAAFLSAFAIPPFSPPALERGTPIRGFIGFDGGSTTSKAVLIDEKGELLAKEYLISRGNPIEDAKEILLRIKKSAAEQGCPLEILGFGATGYAADVLDSALRADANVVETIAHMLSAKRYCGDDVDVICDIGGQDIKVLFLQNGTVKNFRLSNQCSAGNGMLLQSMADQFGVDIKDFAGAAFKAQLSPRFSYGCAVFLDADRVNFQREGYTRDELFAGLAMVLPKNIWQYVVQIPRLAELGRRFVLQGGTQRNLAALKAQVDYIKARAPGAEVRLHPHCGEAGAIGAALEARRAVQKRGRSLFIGLDAAISLEYRTQTTEATRCHFCTNECLRTFIDTKTPDGGFARYIAGFSCEKGTVESKEAVVRLNQERKRLKERYPNLIDVESDLAFRHRFEPAAMPAADTMIDDVALGHSWLGLGWARRKPIRRAFIHGSPEASKRRREVRIGIPRVLSIYTLAPFLRTYLESLGVSSRNIVFSDETSEDMWLEGGRYGSIDPCYPSKVAPAHLHDLIFHKHAQKPLDCIWFPTILDIPTFVSHAMAATTCPIVAGAPKVAAAALTRERDLIAEAGLEFVPDVLNFQNPDLLRRQLFLTWARHLGVSADESDWACGEAWKALEDFERDLQRRGRELLDWAEREERVALLVIARPYHGDPGMHHGVVDEFQALGYPALTIRSIPKDAGYLHRFFRDDLAEDVIDDVFDVRDVWPENYSAQSVQKVWAAKFAARHPNVAVLDLSSFKCGSDSPTYGLIDRILAVSRTPHLTLHDLDANKPGGSIKIRVKTFAYTLERYRERLVDTAARRRLSERVGDRTRMEAI